MNKKKKPTQAQSDVCGPNSMTLARLDSIENVFAYNRLLHEVDYLPWLGMMKKERFTTTDAGCKTISFSYANVGLSMRWMIGDPQVSSEYFQNYTFEMNDCNENCAYIALLNNNQFRLNDGDCEFSTWIVCRYSGKLLRIIVTAVNR